MWLHSGQETEAGAPDKSRQRRAGSLPAFNGDVRARASKPSSDREEKAERLTDTDPDITGLFIMWQKHWLLVAKHFWTNRWRFVAILWWKERRNFASHSMVLMIICGNNKMTLFAGQVEKRSLLFTGDLCLLYCCLGALHSDSELRLRVY